MSKPRMRKPFVAKWIIQVKGKTQIDGQVYLVTAQVIRDNLMGVLDQMIVDKKLESYSITVMNGGKKK